jgi:hypothetical protein
MIIFISGCLKPVEKNSEGKRKNYEPNVEKRARAAAGDGVILGGSNKDIQYEFSNANPIWRASLETLENIPLATANYAGGIISTDWYSSKSSEETVKIQIVFYDNKLTTTSFAVKGFKKNCKSFNNCTMTKTSAKFNSAIKKKILDKTKEIYLKDEKLKEKK